VGNGQRLGGQVLEVLNVYDVRLPPRYERAQILGDARVAVRTLEEPERGAMAVPGCPGAHAPHGHTLPGIVHREDIPAVHGRLMSVDQALVSAGHGAGQRMSIDLGARAVPWQVLMHQVQDAHQAPLRHGN